MVVSLQSLNDDSWVLASAPAGKKSSLAQQETVDNLLRLFALFVMTAVDDVAAGKLSATALPDKLEAEAKRLQGIFYGKDAAYEAARWNTPEQLGKYLVENLKLGGETPDAVERLFRAFCHELVPEITYFHKGEVSEEMLRAVAEEMIERYRYHLMGMPLPRNYAEED